MTKWVEIDLDVMSAPVLHTALLMLLEDVPADRPVRVRVAERHPNPRQEYAVIPFHAIRYTAFTDGN